MQQLQQSKPFSLGSLIPSLSPDRRTIPGAWCPVASIIDWFPPGKFIRYDFENEKKETGFNLLFHSCTKLHLAKQLHALLVISGKAQSIFLSARLINLYAYLGDVSLSRHVFNQIPTKDVYTWNSMVSAYVRSVLKACANLVDGQKIHCWVLKLGFEWDVFVAASLVHIQNGNAAEALDVLNDMKLEGLRMDPITVSSLLPVCAQSDDVVNGILIHLYVIKHGLETDLFVSNALVNMYSKFGSLGNAERVFDEMKMQLIGVQPDLLTAVSLTSIVGQLIDRKNSGSVHGFILRRGWLQDDVVIGNALVDMYAKLTSLDYAHAVFEKLPVRDVISWNTLITGYAQNGLASEAIDKYSTMQECKEIIPNQGTWVSILPAYSHVGALQQGMKIHGRVIKNCLYLDVFVGTCLIDMYGKCGRLDDAMSLFYQLPRKSSVPWNTIISCHGIHGHGENSLKLFKDMLDEGVKPDQEDYMIKPGLKHYGCMVDLLGRAGRLEIAYNFIRNMPVWPDSSIWGALLGACRIHGNFELGTFASDQLLAVDPENVGYYVLLSNIYANAGKWEGVDKVRSLARERGLQKTPGWSSIVKSNQVEVFYAGNQTHPKIEEIYKELMVLTAKIKSLGYVPDYSFVLQDVEEDEKEHILASHSERLAIAFGIITTPPRSPIRIFKNLRVCGDCHNATKFISKITEREIIVRDSNRFHNFKDGACSCDDYW
ncbi:Pentatricopeptide repeat-containing protein [Quillaja saponaria]|uniref:Pentatricopeptide repeat-containing protein n=1 Tax=Quillaja saponaria TaxID=32244 RepID=A0AAD7PGN8_QUISA|nr:Pentatricopeptide repeat-containing protein [Quillaja saponaria]